MGLAGSFWLLLLLISCFAYFSILKMEVWVPPKGSLSLSVVQGFASQKHRTMQVFTLLLLHFVK
jgi:hypothetical protein